jgi:HSP20 family molecular chaperone IbpA
MAQQQVVKPNDGKAMERVRQAAPREVAPPVDIFENEQELLLVADLPGVEPDGLNISLDPPELHIEARQSAPPNGPGVVFGRSFRVDDRIDPNGISAELVQGVLRVHLKKSEALRPRRIAVRTS